ncbi:HEPN domain-containing protein [Lysobacter capsici]|jgi:hypothetical protein|uniref:HEPN domain-containing protein n=1 Tax=Lysobacter capsici TaxID=435897 RepID=UPI0007165EAD|nr:HEPN domain-containing protein [Lysobacter capsici]ALN83350.1 hypothetical protein LC55x_0045 [Lysobacter capsici]ATE69936.1 hypothetical protein CNO08_00185 [Lysobacter capsici]UOF15124.1 HEPN domain-containing protein [Lysobacter capsici]
MPSEARIALDKNLEDIKSLLSLHGNGKDAVDTSADGIEVLNRSAIVLLTSFWEAYCEDIAAEGLQCIVDNAKNADALPKEIKKVIAKKLKEDANELALWSIADKKWRDVLGSYMAELKEARDRKLNTPKWERIDDLFRSAVGLSDISKNWKVDGKLSVEDARKQLNAYVELRGEIAHRGNTKTAVSKKQVTDYLSLVKTIASKTGGAVKKHVYAACKVKLY